MQLSWDAIQANAIAFSKNLFIFQKSCHDEMGGMSCHDEMGGIDRTAMYNIMKLG